MLHQLETYQLENLLAAAAELGAKRASIEWGLSKPTLCKSEAYKLYGRSKVDEWIKRKLIIPTTSDKLGSKVELDRMALETLNKKDFRGLVLTRV
jgi:hypothetical protein